MAGEKVILNIPPESIVVIHNAPYHTVQEHKSSCKVDITRLLKDVDIKFYIEDTRLEIIKRNKPEPIFSIDHILKENDFIILLGDPCK